MTCPTNANIENVHKMRKISDSIHKLVIWLLFIFYLDSYISLKSLCELTVNCLLIQGLHDRLKDSNLDEKEVSKAKAGQVIVLFWYHTLLAKQLQYVNKWTTPHSSHI